MECKETGPKDDDDDDDDDDDADADADNDDVQLIIRRLMKHET